MKNNTTKKFLITLFIITTFAVTACHSNDIEKRANDTNELSEDQQKLKQEQLEEEQRWVERKAAIQMFKDGYDYYYGKKGKIQNLGKAEKLFRKATKKGEPYAPAYLAKILINKYNKLSPDERELNHLKKFYFWLLIAKTHANQERNDYCYSGYYAEDDVFSYQKDIEKNLSANEIQGIQDKATIWWETNIGN